MLREMRGGKQPPAVRRDWIVVLGWSFDYGSLCVLHTTNPIRHRGKAGEKDATVHGLAA